MSDCRLPARRQEQEDQRGRSAVAASSSLEMTAASAWEAFPAPGLSAAVSATHAFANAGTVPPSSTRSSAANRAPQAGQSEPPPKLSFTGDVGIPNNYTWTMSRQQYRGPAAMDNDSIGGKLVNTIGALKLGIKVDY
jgi:hypothetical protein